MSSTESDVSDKILDGLSNYATAVQDLEAAKFGAEMYGQVRREFSAAVRPDDTCTLAFPTVLLSGDRPLGCLVAVLGDRIVIAWQRGILRSKTGVVVIPLATVSSVVRRRGTTSSTRDAQLLVISGTPSATIALPTDRTDTADAVIRTAIGPTPR